MSTAIGVAAGGFGLLATDTRLSTGPEGPHNDSDPWVLQARDGPHELMTKQTRKLRRVPGPAWGVCGGPEALTGCVSLAQVTQVGVSDLDAVQKLVADAPEAALQLLAQWGFNVTDEARAAAWGGNGLAVLRPGRQGVEFHMVSAEACFGGPGVVHVQRPQPLTKRQTTRIKRRYLESVARRPDVTNGELLLAVARTLQELHDGGAWSINARAHCGMLLQSPDGSVVRAARADFDAAELPERFTADELDRVLLRMFQGAPADGSDATYLDLTAN